MVISCQFWKTNI